MSLEGDVFIQQVATYVRRHEDVLAHGLARLQAHPTTADKPVRIQFSLHHLYYLLDRINAPDDVGPLNVKLDADDWGATEPTFISFLTSSHTAPVDSDTKSVSSIGSVKSMVSSASTYFRSMNFSKDPKVVSKDLKYLYSVFTKLPCLVLSPRTKLAPVAGFEEYPCDTAVPLKLFTNLQVLEICEYDPNEIYGWHLLSEQLRILVVKKATKLNDLTHLLFQLVVDDDYGRASFAVAHQSPYHKRSSSGNLLGSYSGPPTSGLGLSQVGAPPPAHPTNHAAANNSAFRRPRSRASTLDASYSTKPSVSPSRPGAAATGDTSCSRDYTSLPASKWPQLKQLSVTDSAILSVPAYAFKPLSGLVKLNLSSNLLEEIPPGLHHLPNLKYLNLSGNYIKTLANLPRTLTHLVSLNLNNNKLTSLSGLERLARCERIDVRRNFIATTTEFRSLVLLYIKCPSLSHVYLAGNQLPKGYRVELFNLFNGVKYKNMIKIDDSRPGYFESVVLMDAQSAFKHLELFFLQQKPGPSSENSQAHVAVGGRRLSVLTVSPRVDNHLFEQMQADPSPSSTPPPKPKSKPRWKGHQRSRTLDSALDSLLETTSTPLAPIAGSPRMKVPPAAGVAATSSLSSLSSSPTTTPASAVPRRYDLGHTVVSTSPTVLQESTSMYELAAITRGPPPLAPSALNNRGDRSPASTKSKRSSTFTVVDSTTAPSILTPVQVTARMSSS
ncbi:hypothetical protein DIURU_000431 [Diutina rugosa]|uniref:Leucine-rich repeat-containing protein n=1 Tax=Diutina rugosa TaxID=5481 RepID=A0A642UYE9_DIURU|nr:uncharacterized protein DIURU_000431 [Diutina rugosa]KAA8907744.1 hypothetical protein DIURU_000431 [Diutina rugosa]